MNTSHDLGKQPEPEREPIFGPLKKVCFTHSTKQELEDQAKYYLRQLESNPDGCYHHAILVTEHLLDIYCVLKKHHSQDHRLGHLNSPKTKIEPVCSHRDLDHGICLDCGKDINEDLVARAEYAADARADR